MQGSLHLGGGASSVHLPRLIHDVSSFRNSVNDFQFLAFFSHLLVYVVGIEMTENSTFAVSSVRISPLQSNLNVHHSLEVLFLPFLSYFLDYFSAGVPDVFRLLLFT